MSTKDRQSSRAHWMDMAKQIVEKCVERREILRDLCPDNVMDDAERRRKLKEVCALNRAIAGLTDEMERTEKSAGIGASIIIRNPDALTRVVVALVVARRLCGDLSREIGPVSDIVDLAGGRDPEDVLAVRNLFREDGPLCPEHVHMSYGPTVDESIPRLKEAALNRVLCQQPDASEHWTDAAASSKRWR